jgi:hypothetical protein
MWKILCSLVLGMGLLLGLLLGCSSIWRQTQSCPSLNEVRNPDSSTKEEFLFPISKNGKWGFINASGEIAIEPQFDVVDRFSEGRAPFGSRTNGKWGFIDSKGHIIVEPRFERAYPFFGGRAAIKVGKRTGFVDRDGREVGGRFTAVSSFHEERAFGKGGDFQWRMFDLNGNFITDDTFTGVGSFSEGLAGFLGRNQTEQAGFINRDGKVVIELTGIQPDTAGYGFRGGIAAAYVRRPFYWYQFLNIRRWGEDAWGFIDRQGKQVVPLQYDGVTDFSECLATVWVNGWAGVINTKGRMIVQPKFSSIHSFSEGLAVVQDGESRSAVTQYGYIDSKGKVVIKPQFSNADDFHEDLAVVQVTGGRKKGYIDKAGKFAIKPEFDEAERFRGGLARVRRGSKSGYINHAGAFVWSNEDV